VRPVAFVRKYGAPELPRPACLRCISTMLRDSGALAYFLQPFGSQLPGFRAVAASGPKYPISLHA